MILNWFSALLLGHEQNASAGTFTLRREKSEVKLVDEEEEHKKTKRTAIRAAVIGQPLLKILSVNIQAGQFV